MQLGWQIEEHFAPFPNLQPKRTVLILDELSSPLLTRIAHDQWQKIKDLISAEHKILWMTSGSQLEVTNPDDALIHGLSRVIRAEDPSISLTTLDVETSSGPETITAIDCALKYITSSTTKTQTETEFVERRGILHVSRVLPDDKINRAEKEDRHGAAPQLKNFHESETCIRLRCERLGTLDSLQYCEVSDKELTLRDDFVEVEIFAAGVNFKVAHFLRPGDDRIADKAL